VKRYVLPDTDVLVDFLRGRERAVAFVRTNGDRILLSPIVLAELYAGVKGDEEEAALDEFASLYRVVPLTGDLAKTAGILRRDYGGSHGVGLADALLAATARAEKADVATLNVKHYPMIQGLQAAYTK
jgi:hypothetical protein